MAIRLGNIAEGDDFFARTTELDDFWECLEGNHVVLSGPRRLGKSSLLTRLAEQAKDHGLLARLIDVGGVDTAEDFVNTLAAAYPDATIGGFIKTAGGKANSWLSRIKMTIDLPDGMGSGGLELKAAPEAPWRAQALELQQRLANAPVLILIDEFSVFLEKLIERDRSKAELLLGWLRAWRQGSVACRLVFSGSIGINSLLERNNLTTRMNDCYEFKLGPFRRAEAHEMLTELAHRKGWQIEKETTNHLCDHIGWCSPFYLNLMFDESRKAGRDRLLETGETDAIVQSADVDDAYDRLLATRSRFIHWHQRLTRDLKEPELGFTLAVLSHAAKSDKGLSRARMMARLARLDPVAIRRAERLSSVLLYLEEQGYLIYENQTIQFISFLLRDYWRRNHAI